ncbi:CaiB/BaiF CoA transferase family protein [Pseudarthrobacter sp. DSP2-3-2b1]|uniref:CaiB/BaiF CoA transferase family protein n=1 Tax=Pseudarthrobacter sp. DSP2-3-2b1 TaxID=2804661 RepID=UPI003CF3E9B1
MNAKPLDGTIVLDLTTALSGPYATMLLASLGARVIKIENPQTGGDSSRNNAPYVTKEGISLQRSSSEDMSLSMMLRGRNKESVLLDLKSGTGREVFLELASQAHVVVENYSPGVTRRLGIDYDAVSAVNPRIIYTSITGFGTAGGTDGLKAMDAIIQAMSGVMFTAGEEGQDPVRFGLPMGDLIAPLYAVIGTLAAQRHLDLTGEGQFVDVSMLGSLTSLVAIEPFETLEALGIPQRTGSHVPRLAPFGTFATRNGFFALSAPTDPMARSVFAGIGMAELGADPRFSTRDGRVSHSSQLHGIIQDWAAGLDNHDAVTRLAAAGAPVAPVRQPAEAIRDAQVLARGEVVPLIGKAGAEGTIYASGVPIQMSRVTTTLDNPAHALGADTESVLGGMLGYTPERIATITGRALSSTGRLSD